MALDITRQHAVVQGMPLVQGSDKHFWFGRPQLVLQLIHFSLFQNAFQITYFFWIGYEYGFRSCFHKHFGLVIAKLILGVVSLLFCSYSTLPLYALVTQMGSHMKKSIFDEQTTKALKSWQHMALKNKGGEHKSSPRALGNGDGGPSLGSTFHSSGSTQHHYNADRSGYGVRDASDIEDSSTHRAAGASNLVIAVDKENVTALPYTGEQK